MKNEENLTFQAEIHMAGAENDEASQKGFLQSQHTRGKDRPPRNSKLPLKSGVTISGPAQLIETKQKTFPEGLNWSGRFRRRPCEYRREGLRQQGGSLGERGKTAGTTDNSKAPPLKRGPSETQTTWPAPETTGPARQVFCNRSIHAGKIPFLPSKLFTYDDLEAVLRKHAQD